MGRLILMEFGYIHEAMPKKSVPPIRSGSRFFFGRVSLVTTIGSHRLVCPKKCLLMLTLGFVW